MFDLASQLFSSVRNFILMEIKLLMKKKLPVVLHVLEDLHDLKCASVFSL